MFCYFLLLSVYFFHRIKGIIATTYHKIQKLPIYKNKKKTNRKNKKQKNETNSHPQKTKNNPSPPPQKKTQKRKKKNKRVTLLNLLCEHRLPL